MLSDSQRRALQEHADRIDRYETELQRERDRLMAPDRERDEELSAAIHSVDMVIRRPDIHREIRDNQERLAAELDRYDREHRPDLDPWDTPARLVKWIEAKFQWWEHTTRSLGHTPTGRLVLAGDPDRFPVSHVADAPAHPEGEARITYREAMRRALAFTRIAPDLIPLLPGWDDPVAGLRHIQAIMTATQSLPFGRRDHGRNEITAGDSPVLDRTDQMIAVIWARIAPHLGLPEGEFQQATDAVHEAAACWAVLSFAAGRDVDLIAQFFPQFLEKAHHFNHLAMRAVEPPDPLVPPEEFAAEIRATAFETLFHWEVLNPAPDWLQARALAPLLTGMNRYYLTLREILLGAGCVEHPATLPNGRTRERPGFADLDAIDVAGAIRPEHVPTLINAWHDVSGWYDSQLEPIRAATEAEDREWDSPDEPSPALPPVAERGDAGRSQEDDPRKDRRCKAGDQKYPAKLLDHMEGRKRSGFDDIRREVWGGRKVSDGRIRGVAHEATALLRDRGDRRELKTSGDEVRWYTPRA